MAHPCVVIISDTALLVIMESKSQLLPGGHLTLTTVNVLIRKYKFNNFINPNTQFDYNDSSDEIVAKARQSLAYTSGSIV